MAVVNFTPLLGLALPDTGDLSGTWGATVNTAITDLLDDAVAGTATLTTDANVTLTTTNGVDNQARNAIILCTGARTAIRTITAPAQSKVYVIVNATSGGFAVKIVGAGPTTGVTVATNTQVIVAWNGSDFVVTATGDLVGPASATDTAITLFDGATGKLVKNSLVTVSAAGAIVAPQAGSTIPFYFANQAAFPSAATYHGALAHSHSDGAMYFAHSSAWVRIIDNGGPLGTPSSGTATNLTGLPLTTGVTGLLPVANGGTGTATPSLVQGTNVTVSGTWPNQTINSTASGTGDVVGPASSTDNAFARFDSTTGKLIQNSTATLGDTGEAVFAKGTFGASSGGVTTVIAIGNTLSNIEVGDPSTGSSSGGIQFKGGSGTTNWVIAGNGNVNSGIEITPSTTVNGTTFNAPVVKVTSTGLIAKTTIAVGNATPSTSGSGITFPASQSASSDVNTLDDYEEGQWTPSLGGTTTYSGRSGRYTKVGNMVFLEFYLEVNLIGTGSTSTFDGLPFTNAGISNGFSAYQANLNVNVVDLIPRVLNYGANTSVQFMGRTVASDGTASQNIYKNTTAVYGSLVMVV